MQDFLNKRSPIHILLVEANPVEIRSIWNMLHEKSKFKFTVEAVNQMPAAYERAARGGVDVILLDLALVTPLEETDAVKRLVAIDPQLPILVLTVLENEHLGLQALEAGAQDYLLKEDVAARPLVRALYYAIERKEAEARLQAAENRFELTIDGITDYAIMNLDPEGNVTTWSVGAEQIFGYSQNEILGQNVEVLFPSDDREQGTPQRELYLATENQATHDGRWMMRQDGTLFFASGELFTLRDVRQHVIGFIKVCRDTTLQKQAEDEREQLLEREQAAYKEAKAASQALEKSLALLAHELRTPLTSIKGFATTLLAEYPTFDPQTWHDFVEIIDDEASKLTELTSLLFDLMRMRAGVFPIEPELTHLEDIWVKARPQAVILTQKHHLIVELYGDFPPVMADARRISQVITNLIGNAVKFSPSETDITVRAKQIVDFVQIEISDQGIGIPPEERERVFEAFHQVEGRRHWQGAGLGTAISKGIVEAHGGRIWVEEQSSPGTSIIFTLPIAK